MTIYQKKICRFNGCGKTFTPVKERHYFCTRQCFCRWYARNTKESKYPIFACPSCGEKVKLNFYPKQSEQKQRGLICPRCQYRNDTVENDALAEELSELKLIR